MKIETPPDKKAKKPPPIAAPAVAASEPPEAVTVSDTAFPVSIRPAGIIKSHSAAPIKKPLEKTFDKVFAPRKIM